MDYRSQGDHSMVSSIPYSNNNSNPNPNPSLNPIRASAFSKPSPFSSSHHLPPSPPPTDDPHTPIRNGSSAAHHVADNSAADHGLHHHPAPDLLPLAAAAAAKPPAPAVRYRECLRNHAAAVGGHVLDGCCEFMPGDADPLKCAACDCHRSFHRKLTDDVDSSSHGGRGYHHRRDRISVPLLLPPPHPLSHHKQPLPQQHQQFGGAFPVSPSGVVPPAAGFGGGGGGNNSGSGATTESSSEERLDGGHGQHQNQQHPPSGPASGIVSKKRFRTKFTPAQKEKMMGFAERAGWRMPRQDDAGVEEFCREVGIRRQVLKVWMHNNKHNIIKKNQQQQSVEPHHQVQVQVQLQQPPQVPAAVAMRGEI